MKQLHYNGDRTADIVGQLVGPTLLGQVLTIISADYDPATDTTTAHLRPATQPEVDAHVAAFKAPAVLGGVA